jgi:protein-disulfide isomerase
VLGAGQQLEARYVQSGEVTIVFWPVLNYGEPSMNATLAVECVARQDMDAFWDLHHQLFQNQADLWRANRDYFIQAAASVGADPDAFAACFDDGDALAHVQGLDQVRRARGIFSQPVFDIGGEFLYGSQSFDTFASVIDAALAE